MFLTPILMRLLLCVITVLLCCVGATGAEPWIIDTHTHFKGAAQVLRESKQGKRQPQNTLGKVVTPEDFRVVADRLKIQATLVVEAVNQSDPQFNEWVLAQAKSDLVCGYLARGDLSSPDFLTRYLRYKKTEYLRGYRFRIGELHGYLKSKPALKMLKRLEEDGMVVDLLVESNHAADVTKLASIFPALTIVIDHCFRVRMKDGKIPPAWEKAVQDCSKFPNVVCKLSSVLNFTGSAPFAQPASKDLKTYRHILKTCFDAFGEDRVVFGTNWPVCTHFGKVDDVVSIVSTFLALQSETALRKGMRNNAIRIFKIREEQMRGSPSQASKCRPQGDTP